MGASDRHYAAPPYGSDSAMACGQTDSPDARAVAGKYMRMGQARDVEGMAEYTWPEWRHVRKIPLG
ncbi:MAG: hypothetical protein FWF69_03740 [Firmicutes bacterium]|nr:hypothetical protein [Bacillota bacterium]